MKKYIITLLLVCCALILNIVKVDASEVIGETNATIEDVNISLTLDKDHYNIDEEITLIINNVTIEEDPIYQYNKEGLKVIDTNITNDNTMLKVKKDNIDTKATLEIIVTMNNKNYHINVYSYYDNRYGVFLSRQSYDDAFEKYNEYLLNNSYITKEEYIIIREKHYSQYAKVSLPTKVITSRDGMSLMSEASTTTTISGTISWKDDWGNIHPCKYLTVELMEIGSEYAIGTTITNEEGQYTFSSQNVAGLLEMAGYDLYLKICADVEGVEVYNSSNITYSITTESQTITDVVIGNSYQNYNVIFEMNGDLGKAFQILQAVSTAYRYAKVMNSNSAFKDVTNISKVQVHYPYDDGDDDPYNDNCFYKKIEKKIYICGDSRSNVINNDLKPYATWDVIMHEYAHHIQQEFGISESHGGFHIGDANMPDHYYEEALAGETCERCMHLIELNKCKEEGIKLTWAEGWATYFAFVAQDYYRTSLNNIRYIETGIYNSYNGKSENFNSKTYSLGEGCEHTVTQFLYKMYNSNNDYFDTFSLGHQTMWDYTMLSRSITLSDFINYLLNNDSISYNELGKLLSKLSISPSLLAVENIKLHLLPKFNWSAGGNSDYFSNNEFILVLTDSSGNEVLRKTGLTATSYTLTEGEWSQVLAASGDVFKWRIIGEATKDYTTGPYSTAYREQTKPSPTGTLTEGTSISGTITSSIDYKWYKFTAPTTGTYEFYTTGSVDTYGQIYNSLAYADTTYNLIANASNDNGGTDNNCSVEIGLTSGQTVYFKVKSVNNSIGSFTVSVHKHSYVYQWLDLTKHNKTCSCEENVQEGHVVSSDAYNSGASTAPCLLCGGNATIGFIEIQNNIIKISENGSFILSSGLVVLVDEDIESYMNGTLIFRNNDEDIM